MPLAVYGARDERAVAQLRTCVSYGDPVGAALMADHHVGYSQPIGGVAAYGNYVSVTGVGFDIGCGLKGVRTDVRAADVPVAPVMDEIVRRVSFGVGRANAEPAGHPVLDRIRDAEFEPQRGLLDLAAAQLGTVGSGNHFVNLMSDEDGWLWAVCHFGSRGFGHQTAAGFLALAQGLEFSDRAREGEMNSPPVLVDARTDLGQAYIAAMQLAGAYACAGRDWVCDRVLAILGASATASVHEHHNFAWHETLPSGQEAWVVRKGATPALPGQQAIVGGSMEAGAAVIEGLAQDPGEALASLNSTVHGAGRVMSRTAAAGKWRKVWTCSSPGCTAELNLPAGSQQPRKGACPRHQQATPRKRRVRTGGAVDFAAVQARLKAQGIVLRGAGADEAPEVYKDLTEVLRAHAGQVRVVTRLAPLGVAMAPSGTSDPYKD